MIRLCVVLQDIGVSNQLLVINGVLKEHDDELSSEIFNKQQNVLKDIPEGLRNLEIFEIPLRPYNITGIENIRAFFNSGDIPESVKELLPKLKDDKLTEVLIITLPEATPYYEAKRFQEDLKGEKLSTLLN